MTRPLHVIAGGSGFIGTSLAAHLISSGADVVVLSRSPARVRNASVRTVTWDGRTLGAWAQSLEGATTLINLTGRSVDCVKTPDHKDEILRSRVESTRVIGKACRTLSRPPGVWIQMSTAHIYGDPPTHVCDETSETGVGFAPIVGKAWEAAFESAALASQRRVVLRTSFVIGRPNAGGAGALGTLSRLARWGLGGRVGSGTQVMSWIHERDFNRIVERVISDATMQGVYIASSPEPVAQDFFMRELRRAAGGLGAHGVALPSFAWMVRIGAPLVMRTDPELALYGRSVMPRRLLDAGFRFYFGSLREAIIDLYKPDAPQ